MCKGSPSSLPVIIGRSPKTPTKGSSGRIFHAITTPQGKDVLQVTPHLEDSPFSTPPSAIRRHLFSEESPQSLKKPNFGTSAGPGKLQPQSSGLFNMEYNSQFQIEQNVDDISEFLSNDVWEADGDVSP